MTTLPDPWAPFEPTAAEPWNRQRVAHLHRRAGLGATWAELQRDLRDGPAASVARLLHPPPASDEGPIADGLRRGVAASRDADRLKAYALYRALYGPDPLREKLTLFWHGQFATSNRKVDNVPAMLEQHELLRRHALGNFGDLLAGVAADPAMLAWLDGGGSRKEKPNENFARELLELFTLGVGHYTERDVRAAARAFTGWVRDEAAGEDVLRFHFDPARADDGPKTFLGRTGRWRAADVLRIILEQPACAEHLCRRLYRFLVSEAAEPGPELIAPLATELRRGGYAIGPVVGTILRSRHFYAAAAYRQRVKSPVEFSAGLVRTLEVPRADVDLLALAAACARQGQELFYPPSVRGWDGGRTWVHSSAVLERSNWAADVLWGNADLGLRPYEPRAWAERHEVAAGQAVAAFARLLLQDDLGPDARGLATRAARDGTADGLRKAVQVLVHCPEYQLA